MRPEQARPDPFVYLNRFRGIILLNLILWALIPGLVLGNLHVDTLEALYWFKEPAFGYWKHPPLTTWLLGLANVPGTFSILSLLFLSQALTVIAGYYIWRCVKRLAGENTAALSVMLFYLSTLASFYSLQINHNTVLAPFIAATLCYGLEFLEERSTQSMTGLGIAVGLGTITKYEILFAIIPLLALSLLIKRFRSAYLDYKAYGAIGIAALIITPHVIWLIDHDFISIKRATGSAPITGWSTILDGLSGILWGGVVLFATLFLALKAFKLPYSKVLAGLKNDKTDREWIGLVCFFGAPLSVAVIGLLTGQFIKALWLLPLVPSICIGAALLLSDSATRANLQDISKITLKSMIVLCVLFWVYLLIGALIKRPHEAFFSNTKPLAEQVEALWARHQSGPLSCVIINEVKLGGSPVLWLKDRPLFIEIPYRPWGTEDKQTLCNEKGAITIELDEGVAALKFFPRLCKASAEPITIKTLLGSTSEQWKGHIAYLPPQAEDTCP